MWPAQPQRIKALAQQADTAQGIGVIAGVIPEGGTVVKYIGKALKSESKIAAKQTKALVKEATETTSLMGKGGKTSRAARREAMRKECIPTSQQPLSQSQNGAGREYRYETPKEYGGTQIKSVQQQTKDVSHPGQPHWEAGAVKTDPATGEVRMNNYERPKLQNDKTKVEYDE